MLAPPSTLLQPPVFYPVLPYITTVFGGLCQGRMVCIAGTVPRSCRRFWVDFQCGSSVRPRADVPFRLTATFGASPCVSCSALWNGRWGPRQQCRALSLREGCLLHLLFHFQEDSVLVVANGNRLLEFKYRRPRRTMDTLKVTGPVLIKVIGFINQDPYHPLQTQYPSRVPFSLKDPALDVPLLSRIESGLAPGHRITIRGQLHADAQEFVLVLSEDPRGGEAGDPRGGEAGDVPLRMTVDFRRDVLVLLLCGSSRFRLAVNGAHLCDHSPPALSLPRVRQLWIGGNLLLYWAEVQSPREAV